MAVRIFDELDARAVAWLRVAVAGMLVSLAARAWRRTWTRSQLQATAAFGVTLAFMNVFFYLAIERLPLGTAVAIEFIGPISIAAWGSRSRRAVVSLILATSGVVMLCEISFRGDPLGVLFILLAAVFWAGYILLGHRLAGSVGGFAGLGVAMGIGAIAVAPFAAPVSGPAWTDPRLLAIVALVAILSNVIPYGFDQIVLRRLSPSRFALLLALLPVTATVVGAIALQQTPTAIEVVGIGLVVAGIATRDRSGEVVAQADLEPGA